jgi:serine/threonine protein kinase
MEKFQIVKNLGDGTYGTVVEAINKQTREKVAIKKLKRTFNTWDECMSLREIKMLRKLNHPNVIKLKEVIREQNSLYLIFEHVNGTVLDLIRESKRLRGNKGLKEDTIKSVVF